MMGEQQAKLKEEIEGLIKIPAFVKFPSNKDLISSAKFEWVSSQIGIQQLSYRISQVRFVLLDPPSNSQIIPFADIVSSVSSQPPPLTSAFGRQRHNDMAVWIDILQKFCTKPQSLAELIYKSKLLIPIKYFSFVTFPAIFASILSNESAKQASIFLQSLLEHKDYEFFGPFFASYILCCHKFSSSLFPSFFSLSLKALSASCFSSSVCTSYFLLSLSASTSLLSAHHLAIIHLFLSASRSSFVKTLVRLVFIPLLEEQASIYCVPDVESSIRHLLRYYASYVNSPVTSAMISAISDSSSAFQIPQAISDDSVNPSLFLSFRDLFILSQILTFSKSELTLPPNSLIDEKYCKNNRIVVAQVLFGSIAKPVNFEMQKSIVFKEVEKAQQKPKLSIEDGRIWNRIKKEALDRRRAPLEDYYKRIANFPGFNGIVPAKAEILEEEAFFEKFLSLKSYISLLLSVKESADLCFRFALSLLIEATFKPKKADEDVSFEPKEQFVGFMALLRTSQFIDRLGAELSSFANASTVDGVQRTVSDFGLRTDEEKKPKKRKKRTLSDETLSDGQLLSQMNKAMNEAGSPFFRLAIAIKEVDLSEGETSSGIIEAFKRALDPLILKKAVSKNEESSAVRSISRSFNELGFMRKGARIYSLLGSFSSMIMKAEGSYQEAYRIFEESLCKSRSSVVFETYVKMTKFQFIFGKESQLLFGKDKATFDFIKYSFETFLKKYSPALFRAGTFSFMSKAIM